jgi:hypothetical protein
MVDLSRLNQPLAIGHAKQARSKRRGTSPLPFVMNLRMKSYPFVAGLLALCAASLIGCKSANQPGSTSHGSLIVKGRSDMEIRQVTKAVFAQNEYAFRGEGAEFLEFQRPGSRREALKWGGWAGEGVVIRAKVKITKLGDDSRLLQLDMFAVRDAGDGLFESESRMLMVNRRPYSQLLGEVGKRLRAP